MEVVLCLGNVEQEGIEKTVSMRVLILGILLRLRCVLHCDINEIAALVDEAA